MYLYTYIYRVNPQPRAGPPSPNRLPARGSAQMKINPEHATIGTPHGVKGALQLLIKRYR